MDRETEKAMLDAVYAMPLAKMTSPAESEMMGTIRTMREVAAAHPFRQFDGPLPTDIPSRHCATFGPFRVIYIHAFRLDNVGYRVLWMGLLPEEMDTPKSVPALPHVATLARLFGFHGRVIDAFPVEVVDCQCEKECPPFLLCMQPLSN